MSRQNITFEQGSPTTGDSGERGNNTPGVTSIKPYADGEPATAAVFDRSPENIRQRTEVVRTEVEGQKYLQDSDMRWIITRGLADGTGGGGIPEITTWDPVSGTFVLSDSIVVQPLNTPSTDLKETLTYGFPDAGPVTGTVTISSLRFDFELANTLRVIWEAANPVDITGGVVGKCDLTLTGEGGHILTIYYANTGVANMTNINTIFTAYAASLTTAGFACSVAIGADPNVTVNDFDPIGSLIPDITMSRNFDRELHYIQPATFATFFGIPNSITDGDTLAIAFADLFVPATNTGRRERVPGLPDGTHPAAPGTPVSVGELFISSLNPESIPGCIPLCKRIGDDLLWLDGTFCYDSSSVHSPYPLRFGEHGYTVDRIANGAIAGIPVTMTSMWFGAGVPPAWTTINSAFNGIVGDLGSGIAPAGSSLIGTETTALAHPSLGWYNVPAPGDSVSSVITNILTLLNAKASLNHGAAFGAEELITGRWRFDAPLRMGTDQPVLRQLPSNILWHLVYRNAGGSELDPSVIWCTYSRYESLPAATTGYVLDVTGAYANAGFPNPSVTTPAIPGSANVSVHLCGNNYEVVAVKAAVAGATTLHILDAADWDYHWFLDSTNPGAIGSTVTGSSSAVRHRWEIDQDFTDTGAIYVASHPWSLALEGLYAQPEDIDNTVTWTEDTIVVSPGRALVHGLPIVFSSPQVLHPQADNLFIDPTSVPLADGIMPHPFWYYLWLRSDGSFRLGDLVPVSDWDSADPGNKLYRTQQVDPGYSARDYTLVDVVSLMFIDGGGDAYFDCAPPVGGTERRLLYRNRGGVCQYGIRSVHDAKDITYVHGNLYSKFSTAIRSPGIPTGVTCKAIVGYYFNLIIPDGEFRAINIGLNSSDGVAQNGLYPSSAPLLGAVDSYFLKYYKPVAGSLTVQDAGRLSITTRPDNSYWDFINGTAATDIDYLLFLLGFEWDRRAGSQAIP